MSQVQFDVTINIVAPVLPLAEGSSSGSATFTQGVEATFVLTPITGGKPPYNVALDGASKAPLPTGIVPSIDAGNNLVLSGTTNDPVGTVEALLDVTDSDGQSVAKVAVSVPTAQAAPPPE